MMSLRVPFILIGILLAVFIRVRWVALRARDRSDAAFDRRLARLEHLAGLTRDGKPVSKK
jgi:hypothetical protein